MSDWAWVTQVGARGEIPVEIQPAKRARFVLDFVKDVEVESYDLPEGMKLIPGDICVLTVEVTDVRKSDEVSKIAIKIFDVEFIRESSQRPSSEIKEMMQHLEKAKELPSRSPNRCSYCVRVDSSTPLSIKRDLHACAKCGRILTTKEYNRT